jgi:hypothetical protein
MSLVKESEEETKVVKAKTKAKKKPGEASASSPQAIIQFYGKDIHGKDYIFSYDPKECEFWCEWCKKHYPYGLLFFWGLYMLVKTCILDKTGKPFVGEGSKTVQKVVLGNHLLTDVHWHSIRNEGYKLAKEEAAVKMTMDRFSRPALTDVEALAGEVRLTYSLFRQEIPFAKHLFIHRAAVSWCGNEFLKRIGHLSNESIRQILRVISNNLRGSVDAKVAAVRFLASLFDDGSDCRQLSHLLVFLQFVWPPPSKADPCGLAVCRSYEDCRPDVAPGMACARCARKDIHTPVLCSNGHAMCVFCLKILVLFFLLFTEFLLPISFVFTHMRVGATGDKGEQDQGSISLPERK